MLIVFDGKHPPALIRTRLPTPCRCAHEVDSYVQRELTPEARTAFELHLMECAACLRSVHLERLPRRESGDHKTNAGSSGAGRVRRRR
jgi:Putative zinc-finger